MISTEIVVPDMSQITRLRCLGHLKAGLPRVLSWQKGRFGPSHTFTFDQLSHLATAEEIPFSDLEGSCVQHFVVVGTFRYEFAAVIKDDDVCADSISGSLWRIVSPGVAMFLNSSASFFCSSFQQFDEMLLALPTFSVGERSAQWSAFEKNLWSLDPDVFQHQVSFWPDIIGEAILGF